MSNLQHLAIPEPESPSALDKARENPETYRLLEEVLLNKSGKVQLHDQFRALFTLKCLGNEKSIDIIAKGFCDPSALLRHELAYVLGQMGNPYALPELTKILETKEEDPMVRHEAAEAMGAISDTAALGILESYLSDPEKAVAETCELAIAKIKYDQEKRAQSARSQSAYTSVDPAPPSDEDSIEKLKEIYLNPKQHLFERYRAMFALRNIGTTEAVLALAEGFKDESALFRHEIAFVYGQMQHPDSVPALVKVLTDASEAPMVRHEAAEALGSIATPEVLPILQSFKEDNVQVVADSCNVALDMYEYENSDQFQYTILPKSD
ncbi:ARM repeat-containing protein [Basidiobolus meristosporus CBS 931.73]|uniref:Deoxyhypusine hydroxylase n=1 Tax=Basidiobolus meristosporus CBS 931.73 TaxID=1314790 RepID=A0A1Y1Z5C4_9FUNG|nr:ARM repeat-containing protein [Basidiobolus meristosporus CBS 931.73]|eukprot:ORY05324.1 ARM repeat-containing protein [Basidiobolus meristosporus CBS 931.73]